MRLPGPIVTVAVEPASSGRSSYIVTAGRYVAVLPRCDRDECESNGGTLPECRTPLNRRGQHAIPGGGGVKAWLEHSALCCHGWHDGRVEEFVAAVRRTHGAVHRPRLPTRGGYTATGKPERLAAMLAEANELANILNGVTT